MGALLPSATQPFRFVRYFSLLSLLAVAAVATLLAWFYGWQAERALIEQGEQTNLAQLQLMVNQWTAAERELVSSLLARPSAPAPDAPDVRDMGRRFEATVAHTSIRKLKLYTRAGLTVFSSEQKQIGELKSDYPGFVAALHGAAFSQLVFRNRFESFGGAISDVYLIGSYLPIRNAAGGIDGVVEIYDDVTPLALAIRTTRWQVIGLTSFMMLLLYLALLGVVRRASRIQQKNHALELEVAERTRVTRETQSALAAAQAARLEAESARAAADSASRAKSVFLATMSHEIRTPLNGVIGMTEVLLSGPLASQHREQLKIVHSSALSLLRLLSDLLDYSRLESEAVQLHTTQFSPAAMLSELVSSMQSVARQHGITLRSCIGADVPAMIRADEGRLRQVIGNLIANAMKFTHHGGVVVELACDPASNTHLRYQVSDSGIGIAADHWERIFRPFEQVDGSITRRHRGAGLGLSICRRLVKLMGGCIGVDSEVGRGSTFWFTICFEPADPLHTVETTATDAAAQSFDARILVVEDNPVNQIVAREMLRRLGCDARVVGSGEEALEIIEEQPFGLILMDLHMGGIDGIETARRMRARETQAGGHPVPIVALTADAFAQTRDACIASGMNDVLAKPFTFQNMTDLLRRVLPQRCAVIAANQNRAVSVATEAATGVGPSEDAQTAVAPR